MEMTEAVVGVDLTVVVVARGGEVEGEQGNGNGGDFHFKKADAD